MIVVCARVQMMNFAYGDKYSPFLHDAVILYAIALNETIAKGLDYVTVRLQCLCGQAEDYRSRDYTVYAF